MEGRSTCPRRKSSARATDGAIAAVVCHQPIQSKYDKDAVPADDSRLGIESEALRIEMPEAERFTAAAAAEATQDEADEIRLNDP
jgi:hypothetical protein